MIGSAMRKEQARSEKARNHCFCGRLASPCALIHSRSCARAGLAATDAPSNAASSSAAAAVGLERAMAQRALCSAHVRAGVSRVGQGWRQG